MAITPLPSAPASTDTTSEFNTKAFAWVGALDDFVTETNATAAEVDADKDAAAASAASAALSKSQTDASGAAIIASATAQADIAESFAEAAESSANAAAASTAAALWVSGTTYAIGALVWSPANARIYRRLTAGAGTTDPSADAVNWLLLSEVLEQADIGTDPNQVPLNQYLGSLAYVDAETPSLGVGTGITASAICKANGGMSGGIYRVSILIDLTGLNSGGTAGDIIGTDGTTLPCYIALLPTITVLGGRMTCLETPAGGDTDIDLYSAAEGTGVEDGAIASLTETQIINGGAQTAGTVTYFSADPAANAYLYLVGQGTANATYTAGRFLIEIFGV